MGPDLRTAFIGTYPPRRCGIATFTRDLSDGMRAANDGLRSMVIAVTDADGPYAYPAEVEFQIRQGSKADYTRAAELINYSDVRLVSVQHEYGIFGGDDGAYILDLMSALQMPSLVTLHTVLKSPSESQRAIVRKMATQSAGLIVMSGVAADLLSRSYDVRGAGGAGRPRRALSPRRSSACSSSRTRRGPPGRRSGASTSSRGSTW